MRAAGPRMRALRAIFPSAQAFAGLRTDRLAGGLISLLADSARDVNYSRFRGIIMIIYTTPSSRRHRWIGSGNAILGASYLRYTRSCTRRPKSRIFNGAWRSAGKRANKFAVSLSSVKMYFRFLSISRIPPVCVFVSNAKRIFIVTLDGIESLADRSVFFYSSRNRRWHVDFPSRNLHVALSPAGTHAVLNYVA
ncbi:hypothetical protein PUN28_000561 [Cardiocondyla obscurior]|uniref:Uncharacterized protein n=1 Tax=Cardiocondyla obscurior TaxID=286306 RepID=A0AAW2H078_9HYME